MAEICNATGEITKTSNDFCVVSVPINGLSKSFLFHKSLFYTFGVQCDGSMRNILEVGMEVGVCYKVSHPGNKTSILTIWLGDKPDVLSEHNAQNAIYDRNGIVVGSVDNNNFLVQHHGNEYTVLMNKEVVFREGAPLNDNVVIDEEITFDAIPFELEHPSGALYQTTCAWIGTKPNLVDRFKLRSLEDDPGFSGDDMVLGVVAVIPNDVVALVDVGFEMIKVLLFRSSFNRRCERIQDVVDVGDRLYLCLGYGYIFHAKRQWFAIKAFKTSSEIDLDSDISEEYSVKPVVETEITRGRGLVEQPHPQSAKNPEVLFGRPPLSGVISELSDPNIACITYENFRIFVSRKNFYMNGNPCTLVDFIVYVTPGTITAHFMAVKTDKCGFTHEVICAWVSRKPSVRVFAESLPPPKFSLLEEKDQIFYGIVSKLFFPLVGFVVIPEESATVLIRVTDFVNPPKYPPKSDTEKLSIANFVKLQDYVQFKLQESPEFPGMLTAYDIRLAEFSNETWDKIKAGVNVSRAPCEKSNLETSPLKETTGTSCKTRTNVDLESPRLTTTVPSTTSLVAAPFVYSCFLQNRGFLMNTRGNLRVTQVGRTITVKVDHIFGTATVDGAVGFFPNDVSFHSEKMLVFNNKCVRFDAEFPISPTSNSDFRVVKMWYATDPQPAPELAMTSDLIPPLAITSRLLYPELATPLTISPEYHIGKIKSIPVHDSAIAIVENVPVLVTLKSLVTAEEINLNTSSIETFLTVGDNVYVKVKECRLDDMIYFRAISCLSLQGGLKYTSEVQMVLPRRPTTRSNIWGLGEYYRREPVLFADGTYFVKFVSSKRPNLELKLNLFERGKVFINEKLATPDLLRAFVGSEITFHVAHEHSEKLSSCGKGMFVACAWIGTEPQPKLIFEEVLSVPKSSISPCWQYEAVVHAFVLPSYALCYTGYVPVLVQILTQNEEVLKDLKIGDRISISATESLLTDSVAVVSRDLKNLKKVSYTDLQKHDVYRNLTGTVIALPEPVGKIKVAGIDIEVVFELCHLCRYKKNPRQGSRKWFASVREKITIGKQVYFSATRSVSNTKKVPYRAFEVYFIE